MICTNMSVFPELKKMHCAVEVNNKKNGGNNWQQWRYDIIIYANLGIRVSTESEVVSTHLWNTPLNLYQQAVKGILS